MPTSVQRTYANKPFEFVRKVIRSVEHYLAFGNGLDHYKNRLGKLTLPEGAPVALDIAVGHDAAQALARDWALHRQFGITSFELG